MRMSRPVVVTLAACAAAGACAGASDVGPEVGGDDSSILGYLDELPAPADDQGDSVMVTYADLDRATEIGGLERPDDLDDPDAVGDWLLDVTGTRVTDAHPVAALVPGALEQATSIGDHQGFVDDVGWSILEVDSYAERDTLPARVTVLDGEFDRDRLDSALDDAGDGVWVAGDPDGELHIEDVTPARPIGQALWLSLDGNRLRVARDERDALPAEADSLADVPALAALAAALDEHEVYSAMLAVGSASVADPLPDIFTDDVPPEDFDEAVDDAVEDFSNQPRCEGLTGVAVGVADDGDPLIVLVLSQIGEEAAEANADVLGSVLDSGTDAVSDRAWSEMVTVESVEAEGDVVVATLRPADIVLGAWRAFLVRRAFPPC